MLDRFRLDGEADGSEIDASLAAYEARYGRSKDIDIARARLERWRELDRRELEDDWDEYDTGPATKSQLQSERSIFDDLVGS